MYSTRLALVGALLAVIALTEARSVIIDDADPQWTYTGAWNAVSVYAPCSVCELKPDPTKAIDGTWHDGSNSQDVATVSFTGVSFALFVICPTPVGAFPGGNFSFTFDGQDAGLIQEPTCGTDFAYNYALFNRSGLTLGTHNFSITIQLDLVGGVSHPSYLLLDYALIDDGGPPGPPTSISVILPSTSGTSTSTSSTTLLPSTKKSVNKVGVGLGVALGVVVLALGGFLIYFCHPARRELLRRQAAYAATKEPQDHDEKDGGPQRTSVLSSSGTAVHAQSSGGGRPHSPPEDVRQTPFEGQTSTTVPVSPVDNRPTNAAAGEIRTAFKPAGVRQQSYGDPGGKEIL